MMKKKNLPAVLLLLGALLITSMSYAQGQTGTICFIRSTGFQGSAVPFTVFVDSQLVCKLNNKKFSLHQVNAGAHRVTAQFAGKQAKDKAEPVMINVEPGKTYYVQLIIQTGFLVNNLFCQEVTESSAKPVLAVCKEDTKCLPEE